MLRLLHLLRLLILRSVVTTAASVTVATVIVGSNAQGAYSYAVNNITDNVPSSVDVASQLRVYVMTPSEAESFFGIDVAEGQVFFAFTNSAEIASEVTEVYIDDGVIVGTPTIENSINFVGDSGSYTTFIQRPGNNNATPPNLPGGEDVDFSANNAFSVDSDNPGSAPDDGVNTASDVLGLAYTYQPGVVFSDVIDALDSGVLKIGLHVRSIGSAGKSDSFLLDPLSFEIIPTGVPIPEPASLLVWGAMIAVGAGRVRR